MAEQSHPFPRSFWTANTTELFERAAYYSMASFVVIYLGQLGLGNYWPSVLNSTLWTIVYFLPILSGTIADHIGFRRSLLGCFVMLTAGYFLMGTPVWFGGSTLSGTIAPEVTSAVPTVVLIVAGIVLIGVGGSFVKPCISGTVQKTAGGRATLAFAIFYTVINIGSLVGRVISFITRKQLDLSFVFAVGTAFSIISFFVVLTLYREPELAIVPNAPAKPKKSVGRILADMVLVLKNARFTFFLVAVAGFFFLYSQVYNVLPLYWKKVLETDPAVDLYTAANPLIVVSLQLLVTKLFGKVKPIISIVVGIVIVSLSMAASLIPIYLSAGGLRAPVGNLLPMASLVGIMTVALIAFGELFTAARTYEYIGAMAPKGQEGLFLGYANLPMALGSLTGGPIGAYIFNEVMCRGAIKRPDGLLDLVPANNATGWLILMAIGLASALLMWTYHLWMKRQLALDHTTA